MPSGGRLPANLISGCAPRHSEPYFATGVAPPAPPSSASLSPRASTTLPPVDPPVSLPSPKRPHPRHTPPNHTTTVGAALGSEWFALRPRVSLSAESETIQHAAPLNHSSDHPRGHATANPPPASATPHLRSTILHLSRPGLGESLGLPTCSNATAYQSSRGDHPRCEPLRH